MKKLLQLFACALMIFVATSCSQGANAIDKAYEQACEAQPVEKVATTLCNGNINCATLTSDESAKLGAVLGYITYRGMYSNNFEDQVDMHQFGDILNGYRELEKNMTGTEKLKMEEYTKNIFLNVPNPSDAPVQPGN